MSKGIVFLAGASAALLTAAGGAVLLLLWQTWEDSRLLELKNRELQASLEASRIRVENFCEYPMDAICPVDTPGGRHGTVLTPMEIPSPPHEAPVMDSPSSAASPTSQQKDHEVVKDSVHAPLAAPSLPIPGRESAERPQMPEPASQQEHIMQGQDQHAQPLPAAEVRSDADSAPASRNGGGDPSDPVTAARDALNVGNEAAPPMTAEASLPLGTDPKLRAESPVIKPSEPASAPEDALRPQEHEASTPQTEHVQTSEDPANTGTAAKSDPQPVLEKAVSGEETPKAAISSMEHPGASLPAQTPASSGHAQDAVQGQVSPASQAVSLTPQENPKRTWTTLDQGADGMLFRIAGSGNALTAHGELLPEKYVVTIDGLWKVFQRQPSTPCVRGMRRFFEGGKTVLEFPLRRTPRLCRVTQESERTIAIEIR